MQTRRCYDNDNYNDKRTNGILSQALLIQPILFISNVLLPNFIVNRH